MKSEANEEKEKEIEETLNILKENNLSSFENICTTDDLYLASDKRILKLVSKSNFKSLLLSNLVFCRRWLSFDSQEASKNQRKQVAIIGEIDLGPVLAPIPHQNQIRHRQ